MYCHQIRFVADQIHIYSIYGVYIVYICVHFAVLDFTAFKTIGEELDKQTNHLQVCLYARVPRLPEGTKIYIPRTLFPTYLRQLGKAMLPRHCTVPGQSGGTCE